MFGTSIATPESRRRSISTLAVAAALTAVSVASQWNLDGNRRVDYRIYTRAVRSIDHLGLYGYGTGILRFTYPPFAAAVIWPFTALDESTGSRCWLVASAATFVVAYALAFRHAGGSREISTPIALLAGSAALWLVPAFTTLRFGQINALVMLLLCLDAVALSRHSRWSGIGTGIAAAIKVTPLAVLPVLVAAGVRTGGRRAALRAVAVFSAITLTVAAIAPSASWTFLGRITGRATGRGAPISVDLRGLLRLAIPAPTAADVVWIAMAIALVAVAMRTAARLSTETERPDGVGIITVAMCLSAVVSPFSSAHHHTFSTVAIALWALRGTTPWHRAVALGGLAALLDPTGGESLLGRIGMVLFAIVTVTALPAATGTCSTAAATGTTDFADRSDIAQDVPNHREERASHV